MTEILTLPTIESWPKVLLHDHLDGGLRPSTVLELAEECGYTGLPSDDPETVADYFHAGASRGDLGLYLETFQQTLAVTQTAENLARVARECAEDLASDGIKIAEVRFAPELHTRNGMSMEDAVWAVIAGFQEGMQDNNIHNRAIICAIRHQPHSSELADMMIKIKEENKQGASLVLGFDISR